MAFTAVPTTRAIGRDGISRCQRQKPLAAMAFPDAIEKDIAGIGKKKKDIESDGRAIAGVDKILTQCHTPPQSNSGFFFVVLSVLQSRL